MHCRARDEPWARKIDEAIRFRTVRVLTDVLTVSDSILVMTKALERWDKALTRLQKNLNLSQEDLARVLGVSARNLARWLNGDVDNPGEAHLQNLQEVEQIVEEAGKALAAGAAPVWFRTPNAVLADLRPLDLLSSRPGQRRVKALLGKIRWGIPA